ncbi:hypothetical protein FP435_04610 [Lactobacillus sp. PV037]|uniref:hypothetical protein n=1 Tax=Lactobacillus sp. PV037 TaxID=2594496 RepID=UPI00223EE83C|nr:hypothetical protein [Lactobacillus sp. PV037]QNQ83773.1 hypothetical protein FP435_04610 [Lactobacillus sp. PV037]
MRLHGLSYDPEKAKFIVGYTPYISVNDNSFFTEGLYKKRTGEYFLYGEGNADSPYASYNKEYNGYQPGTKIKPLKFDEAKAYFDKYDSDEYSDADGNFLEEDAVKRLYDKEFGKIEVSEAKKIKSFSLKESTTKKIARIAQSQGKTQSEVIDMLVENA